ncbi:MAG TPA: PD-(D/E)XK nuclease family protein, partial [Bacteroidales bacterium]|nr:PD-(D/E)XK nuclease family protein [Bacteroidales bacterium]
NDMPGDWSYDTMLSKDSGIVKRQVIETSSDIAQVKLVSDLVENIPGLTAANSHETAIVLADENLLVPLLTSLPLVDDLNITMGYPLKQSLVYTLLQLIIELQSTAVSLESSDRFQCGLVMDILDHSLISMLVPDEESAKIKGLMSGTGTWISSDKLPVTGIFPVIFRKVPDPAAFSSYLKNILSAIALASFSEDEEDPDLISRRNILNEMIYRIVLSLNRLDAVINDPLIKFTNETFVKLLERLLRSQSVPFSGEPLTGIQIMGILETRALDFRNLIILSVNEGVMPAISSPSSFIPFSLRGAFGLPSVNHQESIFAYHFYRLLHRAENVTFTYNSNAEGLRNGEMSRFLIQMKYDEVLKPEFRNLDFTVRPKSTIPGIIPKNETHIQKLYSLYLEERRPLSPSAINTWLACRMKFYYRYINGLKEPEKSSLENDPAVFGNILHEIMRILYGNISQELVTGESLDQIIHNPDELRNVINTAIAQKLNNGDNAEINGTELIIRDVMFAFIQRILKNDRAIAPFRLLHLEHPFSFDLHLENGLSIRTGGIADRIDFTGGKTRIVDYKTGTTSESVCSISELFENDRNKEHDGWLQALIYCEAYLSINREAAVRPSIYAIKKMNGRNHNDFLKIKADRKELPVEDYITVRQEFLSGLKGLIAKIFSPDEPFIMSDDTRGKCRYCSYRRLCLR